MADEQTQQDITDSFREAGALDSEEEQTEEADEDRKRREQEAAETTQQTQDDGGVFSSVVNQVKSVGGPAEAVVEGGSDLVESAADAFTGGSSPSSGNQNNVEQSPSGRNLQRLDERTPEGRQQPSDRQRSKLDQLDRQTPDVGSMRRRINRSGIDSDLTGSSSLTGQGPGSGVDQPSGVEVSQPDRVEIAKDTVRRADRGVSNTVGRGSPASEASRNLAATGLDIVFQDPQEALDTVESAPGIPETGLDVTERTGGIALSGPSATGQPGKRGDLNTDITDSLTEGRGLFPDKGPSSGFFQTTEQELRKRAEKRREFFGVGDELKSATPDAEIAGVKLQKVSKAAGDLPGEAAGAPTEATRLLDLGVEVASNTPRTVDEFGAEETAFAGLETGGRVSEGLARTVEENPEGFATELVGGFALGLGAGKAVQGAPSLARSARIRAQGGEIVDFDDISNPPTRTEGLELPGFTRRAQEDPEVAADEFMQQARRNALEGDTPVAFSGRAAEDVSKYGGFGKDFTAPGGSSELPGLFQAADLSNLRVGRGATGSGLSVPRLGLPKPSTGSSRILAETDIDIDITPGGSRKEIGQFLDESADRGKSFIRRDSDGGPTPEQEVIAPPGSRFVEDGGLFGVRVGGREIPGTSISVGGDIVPGRLTRRVDSDVSDDVEDIETGRRTRSEVAEETTEAISESIARQQSDVKPFAPVTGPTGSGASSSSGESFADPINSFPSSSGGARSGDSSKGSTSVSDSPPMDDSSFDESVDISPDESPPISSDPVESSPPSDGPKSPPSSGPGSPPDSGGGSPPESPPSSPPSITDSPPISPPSSSPGSPPASGPGSPPGSPGSPPAASPPDVPPEQLRGDLDSDKKKRDRPLLEQSILTDLQVNPVTTPEERLESLFGVDIE